jgi:hypothetical protein
VILVGVDWSWAQVCARRLERHALAEPAGDRQPADIAGAICGVHAQVLSAAELSLALRLAGATRSDVRRALWDDRSLVKTYGPRGTVHLLPTRELPMWTGALAAVPPAPSPFPPDVRLSREQTEAVIAAIGAALQEAELTIEELNLAVIDAAGAWAGDLVMPAFQQLWPRWRQAVVPAARRGVLCFGPNRGRSVTYTSPHRWLPDLAPAAGEPALAEVVDRYLRAYGPATPQQFAQWLGAPARWAATLFESLALEPAEMEGTPAWLAAGDSATPAGPPPSVRLLPYFDAYAVNCHPRALLFPGRAAERALAPSGQAGNYPVLLVDGTVAGVWHQRRSGPRIDITVEPLGPLSARHRRELDQQAERLGQILEGRPRLSVGTVTVGGHA